MKRVLFLIVALLCLQGVAPAQEHASTRFTYVDVYVDSKDKALAAWQVELATGTRDAVTVQPPSSVRARQFVAIPQPARRPKSAWSPRHIIP